MITEQKFAALTVKLWRLHQRVTKLQKATAGGVPKAITANAFKKTSREIAAVLRQLQPFQAAP